MNGYSTSSANNQGRQVNSVSSARAVPPPRYDDPVVVPAEELLPVGVDPGDGGAVVRREATEVFRGAGGREKARAGGKCEQENAGHEEELLRKVSFIQPFRPPEEYSSVLAADSQGLGEGAGKKGATKDFGLMRNPASHANFLKKTFYINYFLPFNMVFSSFQREHV